MIHILAIIWSHLRHGVNRWVSTLRKMNVLKSPEPMNFATGNVDQNWSSWEQQFLTYFVACELGKKAKETQVAILLHSAGPEAHEIHRTLTYSEEEDSKDYNTVLSKLRSYCEPRKNIVFERHQFWIKDQLENETIGQWVTGLRTRETKCDFKGQNNMIREKIVFGVRDNAVQEILLWEADLSLERAAYICRTAETGKM